MENQRLRIDIGTDGDNIVVEVWSLEETSEDGSAGTWLIQTHDSIPVPRIMEKLAPGELDPRD